MDPEWIQTDAWHWFPGCTAFWLDPDTPEQVIAWHRKFRPDFRGTVECAGMAVEITDPVVHPLMNAGYGYYSLQNMSLAAMYQQQSMLAQSASYRQYQYGPSSIFGGILGNLL